jgi:hypothetical protein
MSEHKNYNKMYNSGNTEAKPVEPVVEEPIVIEEPVAVKVPAEVPFEEPAITIEEVQAPAYAVGVVANCNSLNVREHPDRKAKVIDVLRAGTEVQVDVDSKLDVWVHVYTVTGLDGFCMKEYIDMKE